MQVIAMQARVIFSTRSLYHCTGQISWSNELGLSVRMWLWLLFCRFWRYVVNEARGTKGRKQKLIVAARHVDPAWAGWISFPATGCEGPCISELSQVSLSLSSSSLCGGHKPTLLLCVVTHRLHVNHSTHCSEQKKCWIIFAIEKEHINSDINLLVSSNALDSMYYQNSCFFVSHIGIPSWGTLFSQDPNTLIVWRESLWSSLPWCQTKDYEKVICDWSVWTVLHPVP